MDSGGVGRTLQERSVCIEQVVTEAESRGVVAVPALGSIIPTASATAQQQQQHAQSNERSSVLDVSLVVMPMSSRPTYH